MLSKQAVKAALHQIEHEYDGFCDSRDDQLAVAHDALSAYERVAALLEQWETFKCNPAASADAVREMMIDELRRALEGK